MPERKIIIFTWDLHSCFAEKENPHITCVIMLTSSFLCQDASIRKHQRDRFGLQWNYHLSNHSK